MYSLYSNESDLSYFQYTAACAVFYFLTQHDLFPYDINALLIYDYKKARRYIWEDKKFMSDINILRDQNLLIRSRAKSRTSRDVNAHQCSNRGQSYINQLTIESKEFASVFRSASSLLHDPANRLYNVILDDDGPVLYSHRIGWLKRATYKMLKQNISEIRNDRILKQRRKGRSTSRIVFIDGFLRSMQDVDPSAGIDGYFFDPYFLGS
ncbi:MAG: hypothetical protein GY751_18910 [Bacteroidetes bacterium]|nr:hypothetical protein [Bacteroidota bacterium]